MINDTLKSLIKNAPDLPGVYEFLSSQGVVLYIGKAKFLKRRLKSYLQVKARSKKIDILMQRAVNLRYTITNNEKEALLLEANLIKKLQPTCNVLLKDDKFYPYVVLSTSHEYPRIYSTRNIHRKNKKDLLLGPYISAKNSKIMVDLVQKLFRIRNCSDSMFTNRTRPCLQYQINQCTAPCMHYISKEDYALDVKGAKQFLSGKLSKVVQDLRFQRDVMIEAYRYEEAKRVHDMLEVIEEFYEAQSTHTERQDENVDFVLFKSSYGKEALQVLMVREGVVLSCRSAVYDAEDATQDSRLSFIIQYYLDEFHQLNMPNRLMVHMDDEHNCSELVVELSSFFETICVDSCVQYLKSKLYQAWYDIALLNMNEALSRYKKHYFFERFKEIFPGISTQYSRCYAVDISHTAGKQVVGGCVCFELSKFNYSAYRIISIPEEICQNDVEALGYVVQVYFGEQHKQDSFDDSILVVDGGKVQLSYVQKALQVYENCKNMILLSVVKGEGRREVFDRVLYAPLAKSLDLAEEELCLFFLQNMRNEAHRFAHSKHTRKRDKFALSSELSLVPGIGPKRIEVLLKHFHSMSDLMQAESSVLEKLPYFNQTVISNLKTYLQNKIEKND